MDPLFGMKSGTAAYGAPEAAGAPAAIRDRGKRLRRIIEERGLRQLTFDDHRDVAMYLGERQDRKQNQHVRQGRASQFPWRNPIQIQFETLAPLPRPQSHAKVAKKLLSSRR